MTRTFRFPLKNKQLLELWLKVCPPGFQPNAFSLLCRKHFELECFVLTPDRTFRKLNRRYAYPTLVKGELHSACTPYKMITSSLPTILVEKEIPLISGHSVKLLPKKPPSPSSDPVPPSVPVVKGDLFVLPDSPPAAESPRESPPPTVAKLSETTSCSSAGCPPGEAATPSHVQLTVALTPRKNYVPPLPIKARQEIEELKKKVAHLEAQLAQSKAATMHMSPMARELFLSEQVNASLHHGRRYSEDVKRFAIEMNAISRNAYKKLAQIFSLPTLKLLQRDERRKSKPSTSSD